MKMKTKIKSKMSRTFSGNFTGAYKKFTMSHMREHPTSPEAFLPKPLNECKVALVSTAGVHLKTDRPFDVDNPAGDHTFRIIPSDVSEQDLTVTHIYIDTKYAKSDPTIVFPLPQLKQSAKDGKIGSVSSINIGLNGGILDTALAEQDSIPKVAELLLNEGIDAALLVPG
ncbi:glycine/sarcosine/betaine reductase selenoprotein B family protein [Planomicrobium okeanokoites]|uniref:glycine/sarcosine/betaine reductase selenoprotein B family protein n=1 Tax=Planomicrobium okeanokoites TaxID=244 RepID=UPI002490060F|nr:glycine/sarcosine/betaine reductase selenoprotein B family protein [Planomicrobium okeanokoites]